MLRPRALCLEVQSPHNPCLGLTCLLGLNSALLLLLTKCLQLPRGIWGWGFGGGQGQPREGSCRYDPLPQLECWAYLETSGHRPGLGEETVRRDRPTDAEKRQDRRGQKKP